jgi:hypothetical protein
MRSTFPWRPGVGLAGLALVCFAVSFDASAVDYFTERVGDSSRFSFKSIRFSPLGGEDYYEACVTDITAFPAGISGATPVELADDGFVRVDPGMTVELYGVRYDSISICSNGYVGLGLGDVNASPTLTNHFNIPKVSGFYQDLDPTAGGTVTWKAAGNQLVVTYREVPLKAQPEQTVSFQIQFFTSGGLIVSWLEVPDALTLMGLSRGEGTPSGFADSNLLGNPVCESACLNAITDSAGAIARVYQDGFGLEAESLDLDVNGISDYANLRLLDEVLAWGGAQGHCTALAAWENNLAILEDKLAVLPETEVASVDREDLLYAMAGMATIGSRRFPQNVVRFLGSRFNLNIGRDELDLSAFPFLNWQGDVDGDGTCNFGEYVAAGQDPEAFVLATLDSGVADGLDFCFGNEPPEEGEDEGEPPLEGEAETDVLCAFPLNGQSMVPPVPTSNTGTVVFTDQGDSVLITVNHNVPLPAEARMFFGLPGETGIAFQELGSGNTPLQTLVAKGFLALLPNGFYVQVIHTGPLGNQDIRGAIRCPFFEFPEGEVEGEGEGEGIDEGELLEGEDPVDGEDPVEGEVEEGEIIVPEGEDEEEGEFLPIELCRATLRGNRSIPPSQTPFTGTFTVTQIRRTAQLVLSHNCQNPTGASINLGPENSTGPALLTFSNATSPITATITLELAQFLTQNTYVRVAFGGAEPGEIRANLQCDFDITEGEDPIEGEGEVEGTLEGDSEGASEAEAMRYHSADYIGPNGILELTEVLRVVQYYNIGGYSCGSGEDGYQAGAGPTSCVRSDFDFSPANWRVDLFELLRIVQLYNAGGYEERAGTEDGFAPLGAP